MPAKFELVLLGDPQLRIASEPVHNLTSKHNQQVFLELLDFVVEKQGMGIAAAQVGIAQRFFIMSSHPNSRYPNAPEMAPTVVINPEIIWASDCLSKDWEGCLSVPGIRGLVPRHEEIEVRYTLANNDLVETKLTGFLARVFQHELDHLNGMVFIDRVESTRELMVEAQWLKFIAEQTAQA